MKFLGALAVVSLLSVQVTAAMQPVAVTINDAKGKQIGVLNMVKEESGGVKLDVNITDLPAGTYAVHIHENGDCTAPDFKSAGDHFNPDKKKHGDVAGGKHAGDLMNVTVRKDRKGELTQINPMITFGEGPNSVFKKGGTAIVVHAKADDYKSQPSGDAGDRIGCGVINAPQNMKK